MAVERMARTEDSTRHESSAAGLRRRPNCEAGNPDRASVYSHARKNVKPTVP